MFFSFDGSISSRSFSKVDLTPSPVRMFIIERMSAISGTFVRTVFSLVKRAAHIIGSTAFFDPEIRICPFSSFPPCTTNLAICVNIRL